MKISSQTRLITAILLTLILGFLGYVIIGSLIYQSSNKSFFAEGRREFNNYDIFFTCFLVAVEIYLTWYFLWKWTIISIDTYSKQVKVFRPFQAKQNVYEFSEINGFYLTSRSSKWCDIKVLVFITSNQNEIKISDFETGNFRIIEAAAWRDFKLLDNKLNIPLTTVQKENYSLVTNKNFDIEQAKSIKSALIISLIGILVILLRDYELLGNENKRDLPTIVRASIIILFLYLVIELDRISRTLRRLKK